MNIENKKQFATILLAVGLGLVAAFMTSQYVETSIKSQANELSQDYEKKSAAQRAAFLKEMDMRDRELSKKIAEMVKAQKAEAPDQQAAMERKQIVDTTIFSELTPSGKRAFTILIDPLSAVGGLVNPGDFVDIIAHLNMPETSFNNKGETVDSSGNVTSILMQNIQVLAVGANFNPVGNALVYQNQQKARTLNVTLAMEPEEAGLLSFAQKNGNLQLILRPPKDSETKILQVASWNSLSDYVLDRQGTELVVPSSRAPVKEDTGKSEVKPFIEIYRGGKEL